MSVTLDQRKPLRPTPGPSLGSRAARGAAVTMGGQVAKILVQFGGIIVLARLLNPRDYGLLAMVVAIVGLGEILRDFGLSSAAVQARTVSDHQRDNLFWINTTIGLVLAATVFAAAGAIASFYDEPLLRGIAQVLSVNFLINGMTTQYRAQLVRDMQFGKVAIADVSSQAAGLAAGVAGALAGAGYWALVAQQVVQSATGLLVLMCLTRWVPGRPRRGVPMAGFMTFGWNLMATQLLGYASHNLGQVLIGHRLGPQALGLYNRAYQLLMMPLYQINAPATTVALPILSRLQDEPERFNAFLLRGQTILVHVIVAVFAFACALGHPLIVTVLGPQWAPAVPIFQVLIFGGVFQAVSYACFWVFVAKGLSRQQLLNSLCGRVLMVTAIVIGSYWGTLGVAAGYSVGLIMVWPMSLAWVARSSDVPVWTLLHNGLRAITGYAVCGGAVWWAARRWGEASAWLQIGIGSATMLLSFGVVCLAWPAFRRDVAAILGSRALLASARSQGGA